MFNVRTPIHQQRGSSLIFSLVVLSAITLGAMVAMQRSTVQLRMIGNMQHQQALFNAAYSDINTMLEGLRSYSTASTILNSIILDEKASLAAGNPIGTVRKDPYRYSVLNQPPLGKTVGSTTNVLRMLQLPTETPNSLKVTEGSSAGTMAPYHFASNVIAVDVNNNARSAQEAGFYYLAPAQ